MGYVDITRIKEIYSGIREIAVGDITYGQVLIHVPVVDVSSARKGYCAFESS
jgi:hypothetical protein